MNASNHQTFWREHPALSLGISALLGAFLYFEPFSFPISFFWIGYYAFLFRLRSLFHAASLLSIAFYAHLLLSHPPLPGQGTAMFSIHSVETYASPFCKGWLYKGTLRTFQSATNTWAGSLPCSVVYYGDGLRPIAHCDYLLEGRLADKNVFKAKNWKQIPKTWSLAELRYQSKKKIHNLLHQHLHPKNADFLAALFTGSIEDRILRYEFGRLGLQHILAISGFHFAILAAFVIFVLQYILPMRMRNPALLFAMILYFLFVGNSPSVQRSFLAASFFLIGQILERQSSALNLLGACLLIEVALNPSVVHNLSFQLSFLSCFGILLLYPPMRRLLQPLFPVRTALQELRPCSQCVALITSFFSRSLALAFAINLTLLPLLLHHFHRFPWLSLIYNLFVPQLAALALFGLLLSLSVYAFSPLFSLPLFKSTDFIASQLLELVAYPPAPLDYNLSLSLPGWTLAPLLILLLFIGIHRWEKHSLAI